jgi:hypothetical protein
VRAASTSLPTLFPSSTGSRLSPSSSHQEPSMTWLRPVDRTSGTLTLNAGTLSCLAHHGTPLSERCPTTTALERTTVPMDDADRMPPLGAVKPALWITSKNFGTSAAAATPIGGRTFRRFI